MDINQKLLKRKIQKKNQRLNSILKVKKRFKQAKKYIDQDQQKKMEHDPLKDKKQEFYEQVFNGELQQQQDMPSEYREKKQREAQNQQHLSSLPQLKENQDELVNTKKQSLKSNRQKKKEKEMIRKMHFEKTRKGQPLMKNYIEYTLYKLEQEQKRKT